MNTAVLKIVLFLLIHGCKTGVLEEVVRAESLEGQSEVDPIIPKQAVSDVPSHWRQIDWSNFEAKVSRYFTVGEVTKYEQQRIPQSDEIKENIFVLAQELDKVREAWGSPILVNSWYRPPEVNAAVGGARRSQHLYGTAADVRPANGEILRFQRWLDLGIWQERALGYGASRGFVHLDLREGRIRWHY